MMNKFGISFFVLSVFSMAAYSQTGGKKSDSVKPAKEVISNNPGEKDLPQKLKEDQLKHAPVISKPASSINNSKATKPPKKNCKKKQNKKSS